MVLPLDLVCLDDLNFAFSANLQENPDCFLLSLFGRLAQLFNAPSSVPFSTFCCYKVAIDSSLSDRKKTCTWIFSLVFIRCLPDAFLQAMFQCWTPDITGTVFPVYSSDPRTAGNSQSSLGSEASHGVWQTVLWPQSSEAQWFSF